MLNLIRQPNCMCSDPNCHPDAAIALDTAPEKTRRLSIALALIAGFAVAEVSVGLISHSLALMAESIHMVSDCGALAIALAASWLAQRSPQTANGTRFRVDVWAALVNGVGLLLIALWILQEAIAHLQVPSAEILSTPMLMTAIAGFGINTLNASLLHSHSHDDLNLRGAFLHMVADAASSVGVILAAIAVAVWGWTWADSVTSLLVAVLIIVGSVPLIRQSISTLLTKPVPPLSLSEMQQTLQALDGVVSVDIQQEGVSAAGKTPSIQITLQIQEPKMGDRLQQQAYDCLQTQGNLSEVDLQIVAVARRPLVNLSIPSSLEILSSQR